jgi:RimJ/RimL family protein N-acetyltransferase
MNRPKATIPKLTTDRLLLRRWGPEDLEPMAAILGDPHVGEWLGGVIDTERTRARLHAYAYHWEEHGFGPWAVEERASGRLVGRTGLMHWEDWTASPHDAEIGWAFARDVWGRGYATEAARAALDWAARHPSLRTIISITQPQNVRSRRVMEKLGLSYRGQTVWRGLTQVWYGIEL